MISVWFVTKSRGLPDRTMPSCQFKSADDVVRMIVDLKAGRLGDGHYMRISAPGGYLSHRDQVRLQRAGAEEAFSFVSDESRAAPLEC